MEFPSEFPRAKHTQTRTLRMGSLFPIQNAFHLGAYQVAINEAADLDSTGTSLSSSDAIEKDCYVYRSYIALGSYQLVLDEIPDDSPSQLQAVKELARYH